MELFRMAAHQEHGRSDLKVGLTGLALGLVWIVLVGAVAHWLAL